MKKSNFLFIFVSLFLIIFIVGGYQYLKTIKDIDLVSANSVVPNPGHAWSQMECSSDSICIDAVNNMVGIGTSSPTKKLEVTGDIKVSGDVCTASGCLNELFAVPSCGTANGKYYPYGSTSYGTDTFCTMGDAVPEVPDFPVPGTPASWVCKSATNLTVSCSASARSWLTGYQKRKLVNIISTAVLSNYQVALNVAYNSNMQDDFDDLRFTAEDQTTLLNYWVESKTNSSVAKVWVKIPSLAFGSNYIYMYYGNSTAASVSNGANTFRHYSDFSDTSNWNLQSGASISSNTLTVYVANPGFSWPQAVYKTSINPPYILQFSAKITGADPYGTYRCNSVIGNTSITSVDSVESTGVAYQGANKVFSDYITNIFTATSFSWDNSNYYSFEHKVTSSSDTVSYRGVTSQASIAHAAGKYVGLGMAHQYCQYQNFIIREYTANEPTSSFGTEESY